jgi:REP element-mobilizing transposase RayT
MRQARIKIGGEAAVYHCISRVVGGERLLDDVAKEVLRRMMWKTAAFSGVEVLAYCLMSNHFHVLVRVLPQESLDRPELLRRYRAYYGETPTSPGFPSAELLAAKFEENGEEAARWEARLRLRMGDLSEFMKTLKERFTIWFNKTHRRFGTLWSERFKSLLVEDSAFALKTVAAYLDLNPVRAGLVNDPADYRWCSYAEAMAGKTHALCGLRQVVGLGEDTSVSFVLEAYRVLLFGKGGVSRKKDQAVIPEERVRSVLAAGGKLEAAELLRARVRHLTEGGILGSRQFLRRIMGDDGGAPGFSEGPFREPRRARPRYGELPLVEDENGAAGPLMAWRRPRRKPSPDPGQTV